MFLENLLNIYEERSSREGTLRAFRINETKSPWINFALKHSKFPTCWQQVSRRVTHLARLKFQPRTRRISATPVAKRFEFASEQYSPRSTTAMFGLISGIIVSLRRAHVPYAQHTLRILSIFKYYSRIPGTGSHVPVLAIRLASFFFFSSLSSLSSKLIAVDGSAFCGDRQSSIFTSQFSPRE